MNDTFSTIYLTFFDRFDTKQINAVCETTTWYTT